MGSMAFKNMSGIKPFGEKVWLSRTSVYQDSMDYGQEAYNTNWMTTAGANVDAVEKEIAEVVGCR
jgi:dTDP-4-amino-4,6-dideoxygalactose transaminase